MYSSGSGSGWGRSFSVLFAFELLCRMMLVKLAAIPFDSFLVIGDALVLELKDSLDFLLLVVALCSDTERGAAIMYSSSSLVSMLELADLELLSSVFIEGDVEVG